MSHKIQLRHLAGFLLGVSSLMALLLALVNTTPAYANAGPPPPYGTLVVGAINEANGQPIAAATVSVFDSSGNLVAKDMTGKDGSVAFNLPEDTYTVAAEYPGYEKGWTKANLANPGTRAAKTLVELRSLVWVGGSRHD